MSNLQKNVANSILCTPYRIKPNMGTQKSDI